MFLNVCSALGIVVGAGLSLLFIDFFNGYVWILTGVAAGNLLYIATSDLLPGVYKESHTTGSFMPAFIATVLGLVVVGGLISLTH